MNKSSVIIHVFPSKDITNIDGYDESIYGKKFSTKDEISLNKVTNGFSVLYDSETCEELNMEDFVDAFYDIMNSTIDEDIISYIALFYYPGDSFSYECGKNIIDLDILLKSNSNNNFRYMESKSIKYLLEHYDDATSTFEFDDNDEDREEISIDEFYQ
jgi:hypothetical protein